MARAKFDASRVIQFGDIDATYNPIGDPISHVWRVAYAFNYTDGYIVVSDTDDPEDGDEGPILGPGVHIALDISTNGIPDTEIDNLYFGVGTQFYARFITAPTTGFVCICGIYARGQ